MLLKNIDEETRWLTEEQNKIRGKLTSNNTKGQTNVKPKPGVNEQSNLCQELE